MEKTKLEKLLLPCNFDIRQIEDPKVKQFVEAAQKLLAETVKEIEELKYRITDLEQSYAETQARTKLHHR